MKPDDWDRFTVEQADALLDWLDSYKKQNDETAAKMKKK